VPEYRLHPYALLFPPMTESEYLALKESIRQHGQRDPIVLWGDLENQNLPMEQCPVLDGRNRLRACEELGEKPKTIRRYMTDADALQYVLDANLHRRHLTDGQRAAIAAEIATLKVGRPPEMETEENPPIGGISQPDAAEKMHVSLRSTQRAAAVKNENSRLHELVKADKLTPSLAEQVAKLSPELQEAFLDKVEAGAKPAEVFATLKRETESAKLVSGLLDTPQVERDSPQDTPQADPPGSQSEETTGAVPILEFRLVNGFLSAEHHHFQYLTGITFHESTLSAPPVRILGKLWVCRKAWRNLETGYDVADCVEVMPLDDYIDALMAEGSILLKPLWFNEWQEKVDREERESDDLRGLKLMYSREDCIGYYVCLSASSSVTDAHTHRFLCPLPAPEPAPAADDEEADSYFAETDTPAAPSGLRSVYRTEKEIRAELVAATTITDDTPLLVVDYVRELDTRFRHFLSEPDVPADLTSRFVSLDDYDFPTYWETLLLNMARRIWALEAVQNGQAVPISAKSLHLLKTLTNRWKERLDDTITPEEYLGILIEQKAEQVGINTDEVTA
jgi:hypothetical protein